MESWTSVKSRCGCGSVLPLVPRCSQSTAQEPKDICLPPVNTSYRTAAQKAHTLISPLCSYICLKQLCGSSLQGTIHLRILFHWCGSKFRISFMRNMFCFKLKRATSEIPWTRSHWVYMQNAFILGKLMSSTFPFYICNFITIGVIIRF